EIGEFRMLDPAIDMLHRDRRTGYPDNRMEDAKAAAIGLETGWRGNLRLEDETSGPIAKDLGLDRQAGVARTGAGGGIAYVETVLVPIDSEIAYQRIIGAPITIANEKGNPPQDLDVLERDTAKIAASQIHAERSSHQPNRRYINLLRAVEIEIP